MNKKGLTKINIIMVASIMIILLSVSAIAQYSSSNPWHPLVQISGDGGTTSVDTDDDGIIDKANASQSCDADGTCEVQTLKSSGNIEIANASYLYVSGTPRTLRIGDDDDIYFNINQMYLNYSSGYLGIGTTTPSQKLHVEGNVNITGELTVGTGTTTINNTHVTTDYFEGNGSGLNSVTADWNSLNNVPAGFADGTDDTGEHSAVQQ